MKRFRSLLLEADAATANLMMLKRLIDQTHKTPQEKIQAMTTLANLVLGGQDLKKLSQALAAPPTASSATSNVTPTQTGATVSTTSTQQPAGLSALSRPALRT